MMDITALLLLIKADNVPFIQLACTYPLLILGFRVHLPITLVFLKSNTCRLSKYYCNDRIEGVCNPIFCRSHSEVGLQNGIVH